MAARKASDGLHLVIDPDSSGNGPMILAVTQVDQTGAAVLAEGVPPAATYVDRSGTITTGGTAQVLAAANTARRGFSIQNQSTGDLWFSSLATAVLLQPSVRVAPGVLYESPFGGCPTGAISIIGATTAQAFTAREW